MESSDEKRQVAGGRCQETGRELLGRAGKEMRELALVVQELEAMVGILTMDAALRGSPSLYEFQKLDHLRQSILGVAEFIDEIGHHAPNSWKLDATSLAAKISLADLCQRLGGARDYAPVQLKAEDGDIELFRGAA